MLWDNCLEEKLDPVMRARIIGVQSQMHCFDYNFGVYVLKFLLKHSDNLSMSACEGQTLAAFSNKTLEKMRNDDSFDSIWNLIKRNATSLGLPEPKKTYKIYQIFRRTKTSLVQ